MPTGSPPAPARTTRATYPITSPKLRSRRLPESLALDLAPEILVNAIAPGPILAPPDLTPEENAKTIEATPLARWGGAEEIATAVLFLVETDFVTGECIRVDVVGIFTKKGVLTMADRAVGIAAEKQEFYKQTIRVRNPLIPA